MISYFLKYFNIHKYIVNIYKHIELRYHDIEKFMAVSKNNIAVLLKFGILQSPNGNIAQKYLIALVLSAVIGDKVFCAHGGLSPFISRSAISKKDSIPEIGPVSDLVWSDPDENNGWMEPNAKINVSL